MAKLHLIANAHIDPVWLWRWKEGFGEIAATFRSAVDRLNEFPELKFTSACAAYYRWIEIIDKNLFEEIRQKVREGRWNIVGGWFVQPDCNIPGGESFARHGLISQRYFKEKFGITAKSGYNVDSFGHNASLPQILKLSGMDNYVFMRPMKNEKDLPANLFLWESPDGSQVCAFRISGSYALGVWENIGVFNEYKAKADEIDQDSMAFFGIGNHGGGPSIKLIDGINHLNVPDTIYSTPDDFFAGIDRECLPVVADELQLHAIGCYSACSFVKAMNRKCENNLLAAEKLCSLAKHLTGVEYPREKLKKAWMNLLFNQFHDILGGCSIKQAYEDAGYLYGEIMSITEQASYFAMQSIARNIDTLGNESLPCFKKSGKMQNWRIWEHEKLGTPVVVFNPHGWPVSMPVQITTMASKMTDENDAEIPFQIVRGPHTNGSHDKYNTIFNAELGPYGYRVYRLFSEKESNAKFEQSAAVNGLTIENSKLVIEFDRETGDICKLYHKPTQELLIDQRCGAILLDEIDCDTWAHNRKNLGEQIGQFGTPEFKVIENLTVRTVMRVTTRYNNSVLQRDYIVARDSDRVLVRTRVEFHEKHKALKFTFPKKNGEVIAKIPYGTIRRKSAFTEAPFGSWFASGKLGVANDSKYGYDTTATEMRMTVLRGAIYADHYGVRDEFCEYMEQGAHEFSYMLFPYTDNANADKIAEELNYGLEAMTETFHKGSLPLKMSCISCDAENIMITAIKQAEDDDGTVIRFCEMNGEERMVRIKLFDKTIETKVRHNEIKTFRTDGTELNLIEWKIEER